MLSTRNTTVRWECVLWREEPSKWPGEETSVPREVKKKKTRRALFQEGEGPPAVSKSLAGGPSVPYPAWEGDFSAFSSNHLWPAAEDQLFLLLHGPPGLGWQQSGTRCSLTDGALGARLDG